LISLHSFTPRLTTDDASRPWQIGILYNQDERAARIALPLLACAGIVAGDNLPYSGKVLNATMNRHGEANAIPYLGIEVRQDLICDEDGVARWADALAPIIATVHERLA
jgi:predicted N-formylglutamate amidohydrolase